MSEEADLLAREARFLVERLRIWAAPRWAAQAPVLGSRADVVHHLARSFVERAGETARPLPRLDSDLALPDQLAVTADDLVRSGRAKYADAAHLLAHRRDLLGEDVPATLHTRVGVVRCPDAPEP